MAHESVRERALVNFPPGLSVILRERAKAGYRSVSMEAVMLIERGLAAETASEHQA